MKRSWLLALLMAGSLVALNSPAFAKGEDTSSDTQDAMEDVNSALGSMASRLSDVEKKQSMEVEIHGFAETDFDFDSELTGKQEFINNTALPKQGTLAGQSNQLQYSVRNSRIDFLAKTTVDGWLTKGYIEGDFLGAANSPEFKLYTQPTFRVRHCYLDVQKDGWDIMAGQYWTLFGWNMDYVLASVQPQPIMGTVYERNPRVSVMKTFGSDTQVQVAVDTERPEMSASAFPTFSGGIRLLLNTWKGEFSYATGGSHKAPLSIGISGTLRTYANGATAGNNWTNTFYQGKAVDVDTMIPILPADDSGFSLTATGEWVAGTGCGDTYDGLSYGVGANPGTYTLDNLGIAGLSGGAFTLIDTQAWNGQVQLHFPKSTGCFITAGYGELFSDNVGTITGATFNDDQNMFANVMEDFTDNVRVAVEVDMPQTHYLNGDVAKDTRIAMGTWYRF